MKAPPPPPPRERERESLVDWHSHQPYTLPPHIAHTDLCPDLVLWNTDKRTVCLVELTICYKTSYEEAHRLKVNKYTDLVEEIKEAGIYSPKLITLEVGSRGPCYLIGFDDLEAYLSAPTKKWDTLLLCIIRTVLVESHKIWTMRNWRDLDSPSTD